MQRLDSGPDSATQPSGKSLTRRADRFLLSDRERLLASYLYNQLTLPFTHISACSHPSSTSSATEAQGCHPGLPSGLARMHEVYCSGPQDIMTKRHSPALAEKL